MEWLPVAFTELSGLIVYVGFLDLYIQFRYKVREKWECKDGEDGGDMPGDEGPGHKFLDGQLRGDHYKAQTDGPH